MPFVLHYEDHGLPRTGQRSTSAPAGAIYLDDLVRRYLIAEGRRHFHLAPGDLAQYALLALAKVIQKYGLRTHSPQLLWECIQLGRDHVLLLPDRGEVAGAPQDGQLSFVLAGVDNVPQAVRRTLLNLVLDEEIRPTEKQTKVRRKIAQTTESAHRAGGESCDSRESVLEWLSREAAERNTERHLALLKELAEATVPMMNPRHGKVIELLMKSNPVATVAKIMGMPEQTVYTILREFRRRAKLALQMKRPTPGTDGDNLAKAKGRGPAIRTRRR